MEYLIKEEELIKHLVKKYKELLDINYLKDVIKVFFTSKQPVEVLEAGLVQGDFGYNLGDKLVKYHGKEVRILVEMSK